MKYKNPISFLVLFLLLSVTSFSQSIVNRANSSYTVQDSRGMWQYNAFIPRYADTTAANLQKGIDSLGAVIFTYDVMKLWVRTGSPKRWAFAYTDADARAAASSAAPFQSGVVIVDKGRYDAFPSAFVKKDTIFIASKNAADHASAGSATIYRSMDGGLHYDSLTVATDSLVANFFAGQFNDTTTIYAFNGSDLQRLYFRRSIDGLQSFQTVDSIILTGNDQGQFLSASTGVHLPSGKYIFPIRFLNTVTSTYSSEIMSTDDGINFDRYGVIFSGSTNKNEATFEYISGATDGTSTIIAVLRSQSNSYPEQYISTNGGVTFTLQGSITAFGAESALGPTFIKKWRGRMYLVKGVRITLASGGSYIGVSDCTPTQAVAGISSWTSPSRIYEARWQYSKGAGIDFGYPVAFEYNNELLSAFYDIAPTSPVTQSLRTTRMLAVRLFGGGGYERNYKTNQSISTGVDIAVDFQSNVYAADSSWIAADTAFIFKRDGWYSVQASFTYPTDTTGTYRQGMLKIIDPFLNTSASNQFLDKVTITGSDNLDFNRIKLTGLVYIHAGNKLKVFAKHDASGALSLQNTDIETRSKIYIKRIE